MKDNFTALTTKLMPVLSEDGYKLESQQLKPDALSAVFISEDAKVKVDYDFDKKTFNLYRGTTGSEYRKTGSYLFDPEGGDGNHEIESAANDFADTLRKKPAARNIAQRSRPKNEDENSAVFFINRIITVLPNCKEPLTQHKDHFETVLPNQFCIEVVVPAMQELLDDGRDEKRITKLFDLLTTMYTNGDLDVKSIIIGTILESITNPIQTHLAEQKISESLLKAWTAGRKFYGKEVKPEKVNTMAKMAARYEADRLKN